MSIEAAGASAERPGVAGLKAEERTEAMAAADQVAVMLSGKSGLSSTRMSWADRRPRRRALVVSSWVRRGPRFSALPGGDGGVSG